MRFAKWLFVAQAFLPFVFSTIPAVGQSALALAGTKDHILIFQTGSDGRVSYNSAKLKQSFEGWKPIPGPPNFSSSPSATALGNYVYLIASSNGSPWMNQFDLGGAFVGWQSMNGKSSPAVPALVATGKSACAFGSDSHYPGAISFNCWPLGGGGKFGFIDVQTNDPGGATYSAAAIGSHIYVATQGRDNYIWMNQCDVVPNQGGLGLSNIVGWRSSHDFRTDAAPALTTSGNRTYMFAKSPDGRVFYTSWVAGGGGNGWKEVEGNGHITSAPAVASVGEHIFLAARASDGSVILNQADAGHPFGQWFPVR